MLDSIKLKLIVFFLAVFTVVFTSLGFFLYYELREITLGSVDDQLYTELTFLAGLFSKEVEHGHIDEGLYEITQAAANGEYGVKLSGHYYQLSDRDGKIIGRSPSLELADKSLPVFEQSSEAVYKNIIGPNNLQLRFISKTFNLITADEDNYVVTFETAGSLEETVFVLRSFRNIIMIVLPVIFMISIIGIYYITRWALKTLDGFSDQVSHITARSLNERIKEEHVDMELKPLARSFNTMLGQLETAFLRQKEFLSDASHELRTPTSVIKSICDVTLRRERNEAEYKEALGSIGGTSKKMAGIIERILEASRLESKTFHMKMEKIELSEILSEVVKLIKPSSVDRGVGLTYVPRRAVAVGDRVRITEVFTNIIDNAVKYTPSGGTVDVDIFDTATHIVVEVSDSGIGISDRDRDVIFERFYRVDKSREEVPGSGLGLSIVRAIVEAHHGTITVESIVGKGSVFKVSLLKE